MKILVATLVLVLLGLQFRLWAGLGSLEHIHQLHGEIEAQTLANAILEQRNSVLLDEVDELKSGLDAVEERARNELGLIGGNEIFYLIVEDEK